MPFYKSLCHRRALFCSKAGPLANGLLDAVETTRAGCHDDIHERAGFKAPATNTVLPGGFSRLIVPPAPAITASQRCECLANSSVRLHERHPRLLGWRT